MLLQPPITGPSWPFRSGLGVIALLEYPSPGLRECFFITVCAWPFRRVQYKGDRNEPGTPSPTPAMFRAGLLVALAYASAVLARTLRVHERRTSLPSGFVQEGPAAPEDVLELRFALTNTDISGLEAALMDAATPGSANFRQWLSKEQVRRASSTRAPFSLLQGRGFRAPVGRDATCG